MRYWIMIFLLMGLAMFCYNAEARYYNAGGWNTGVGLGWGRHGVRPYLSTGYNFAPRREHRDTVYVPVVVNAPMAQGQSVSDDKDYEYQYEPAPLEHHSTILGPNEPKAYQPPSH